MRTGTIFAWLAILVLAGCAQQPVQTRASPMPPGFEAASQHADHSWWRACFTMPFDENGAPRWSMDLLLADRIAGPAITRHASEIPLWRFHRRAARDGAGHRFSLLFYADPRTAAQLFAEIDSDPLVPVLVDSGYLKRLTSRCAPDTLGPGTEASSDRSWDIRLQRTWPYFIMGVSAHWLALIGEVGAEYPQSSDAPDELLDRYGRIGDEIDEIWRKQGQHAYLHHLSALFGYQPLSVQTLMQF
ncbi:MAG: hypothetical protein WC809_13760 [Sinimarinibacterium sp.]|jgi:hypothetical protein